MGNDALKQYREREGLSQTELAGRLGLSESAISRYENGQRRIGRHVLLKISEITGIPPRELRPDLAILLEPNGEAA